jgi:hypothetical protein
LLCCVFQYLLRCAGRRKSSNKINEIQPCSCRLSQSCLVDMRFPFGSAIPSI